MQLSPASLSRSIRESGPSRNTGSATVGMEKFDTLLSTALTNARDQPRSANTQSTSRSFEDSPVGRWLQSTIGAAKAPVGPGVAPAIAPTRAGATAAARPTGAVKAADVTTRGATSRASTTARSSAAVAPVNRPSVSPSESRTQSRIAPDVLASQLDQSSTVQSARRDQSPLTSSQVAGLPRPIPVQNVTIAPITRNSPAEVAMPGQARTAVNAISRMNPAVGASTTWTLDTYPRPVEDTGRGIHWVPTNKSSNETVDRFVGEAKDMKASWVVFLNDGAQVGDNDYLVKKLTESGIEPVMRIYSSGVGSIGGDIEGMVRHYKSMGVNYFQIFNEPNLAVENRGEKPDVNRYLDNWIPLARRVTAAGGLPGFGALAPGGDVDDLAFLRDSLKGIKARGATDTLDHAWLSMHNYTGNRPVGDTSDSNGFLKFRWYDRIMRETIGRPLPVIGTEGGAYAGNQSDRRFAAMSPDQARDSMANSMAYMNGKQEPYLFANTIWVIANAEGGGHDPQWEKHALFSNGRTNPIVDLLKNTG